MIVVICLVTDFSRTWRGRCEAAAFADLRVGHCDETGLYMMKLKIKSISYMVIRNTIHIYSPREHSFNDKVDDPQMNCHSGKGQSSRGTDL